MTGPGVHRCACKVGYKGNGFKCREIPACTALPCQPNAECHPVGPGLRTCKCLPGFENPENNDKVCNPINNCESSPCKGKNIKCVMTGPAQHKCECEAGFVPLVDNPTICDKPGSKAVLEAETRVKLDQIKKIIQAKLDEQHRKENAARAERESIERDFAKRQKQRQEAIKMLEKRVRDLIADRTQARVADRDNRMNALRQRIAVLEKEELDAVTLAKEQIKVIKALEAAESQKIKNVEAEMAAVTQKILDETRRYARELREKIKRDHAAVAEQMKKDEIKREEDAKNAVLQADKAREAAKAVYGAPVSPPRVGDPARFAEEEEEENEESEEMDQ